MREVKDSHYIQDSLLRKKTILDIHREMPNIRIIAGQAALDVLHEKFQSENLRRT